MTHVTPAAKPSILLVDDDPDICRALTDLLEYEQYEALAVGTGTEAIAKAKARSFSAMILDLGLPDFDGLALLKALRKIDSTVPIIILTAQTGEDRKTGCLEAGAYAFLSKPHDKHDLKAILSRAVIANS
jgi:DNA-binding response OmpR family regulator